MKDYNINNKCKT